MCLHYMVLALVGPFAHTRHAPHPICPPPHRKEGCPKNHLEYFENRHGLGAFLQAIHFKLSKMKGPQNIPLAPNMRKMFNTLELAFASHFATQVQPTTYFYKKTDKAPYTKEYFSQMCGNMLVFNGTRLSTNQLRHLFVTGWKDFMEHPSTFLLRHTIGELNQAASAMMLNSPEVWHAYDDSNTSRSLHCALALWPKFLEFMEQHHLDLASQKKWDPLTASMASLKLPS